VAEIAQLMRNHHVGDLIVAEPRGNRIVPLGIVTDRDLVVEILAQGVDPKTLTARDLMDGDLATVPEDAVVHEAIELMRTKAIRRLPVVDAQNFVIGVLTADDVIEFLAEEFGDIVRIVPRQVKLERTRRGPRGT
jgi:CBS domain-containing protein